jgi:peptide subunit release factor 1 (eRF1)
MINAATIRRIREFEPGDLPVVSMYLTVPVDPNERAALKTRVTSLLDQIRPLGRDEGLSRAARLSIRQDLDRIEDLQKRERWQPPAVALFTCSELDFLEEVQLPRRVRDRIVADATPWIRPLTVVLEEFHRAAVLVTDSNAAQVWELFQGQIEQLQAVRDRHLRRSNYAGWHGLKEHTVANKAAELEKHHFDRVVEMLDEMFADPSYELLVLGGQHETLSRFEARLPKRLRNRLAGTFSVDPRPNPDPEVRDRASAVVEDWERADEKRKVQDLFERAASGRPAAIGLRDCICAATTGAIDELLVHDEVTAPGVVCPRGDWLGESGDACPICGTPTRSAPDIVDELVEQVIDEGGSIEHVEVDTELEPHMVGAILRFPLPQSRRAVDPSPEPSAPAGEG